MDAADKDFRKKPASKQLGELDSQLKKLAGIGDSSLATIIKTVKKGLGIKPVNLPAKTKNGKFKTSREFDIYSAQIYKAPSRETVILVDKNGRTLRVPVNGKNGDLIFEVMRRVDKSKVARKIYHELVMPLVARTLESERPKPKPPTKAPPVEDALKYLGGGGGAMKPRLGEKTGAGRKKVPLPKQKEKAGHQGRRKVSRQKG